MTKKVKVKTIVEGEEREIEETQEETIPGYLEAVYHLYSIELKHGPVVVRLRTADRANAVHLPSLTPIYRSAELQEREIYDLYGIRFDGHPDLRRILMWDEFVDYPMRKDYRPPDDFEYEPTPHDEVLERAKQHYRARPATRRRRAADRAAMSTTLDPLPAAPPRTMTSRLDGELLEVSLGPQHPSTHGVFRMNVALDGEVVMKLKPVFGYLHRNHEQIGERPAISARCPTRIGSITSAR